MWIGVSDLDATKRFYETIAPVVGVRIAPRAPERFHVVGGGRSFALVHDGRPPTENLHLAFGVPDNATVDEFHRVALAAGYETTGRPVSGPSTTPVTTARSSSTLTATTSRPSVTTASARSPSA